MRMYPRDSGTTEARDIVERNGLIHLRGSANLLRRYAGDRVANKIDETVTEILITTDLNWISKPLNKHP